MTLLHAACGVNNLAAVRMLVERGASFQLDNERRMPSIVAAEAEADEALCDYIAEQEELFLMRQAQGVVAEQEI